MKWVAFKTPLLFLAVYLIAGLATIKQFGLPLDDFTQYVIGKVNYEYIHGERKYEDIEVDMRYYGPVFETLCYTLDCQFDVEPQPYQKWGMRHALLVLIFTIALGFFYLIGLKLFENPKIAWTLMLLLAFYPRIFADCHYNSKDTLFLAVVTIGLYPLIVTFSKSKLHLFAVSGLLLGLAATLRLSAFFIIPSVAIVWMIAGYFLAKPAKNIVVNFCIFCVSWAISYYAFLPVLWSHPITEFITIVKRLQEFPWPNDTLIGGIWVGPKSQVWWYLPQWFCITVPLAYLLCFAGAVSYGLWVIKKRSKEFLGDNLGLLFLGIWLFSTLIYVMLTKPNLYDSWRQFQFIMVPFLLISGIAIHKMIQLIYGWRFVQLMVIYQLGVLLYLHPFQQVYFNEYYWIFGKPHTYDQDYWHVSTGQGIHWLETQNFNKPIKIYTRKSNAAWLNMFFYPSNPKRQFSATESIESADYEIVPVRNNEYYDPTKNEVYSVKPLKDTILRVIKLR